MIDTDKYEGHTLTTSDLGHDEYEGRNFGELRAVKGKWGTGHKWYIAGIHGCSSLGAIAGSEANARLLADAPLLLTEVKDLKRQLSCMIKSYDSIIDAVREFIETDYCSHDSAEWLRYNMGIEEEESE